MLNAALETQLEEVSRTENHGFKIKNETVKYGGKCRNVQRKTTQIV